MWEHFTNSRNKHIRKKKKLTEYLYQDNQRCRSSITQDREPSAGTPGLIMAVVSGTSVLFRGLMTLPNFYPRPESVFLQQWSSDLLFPAIIALLRTRYNSLSTGWTTSYRHREVYITGESYAGAIKNQTSVNHCTITLWIKNSGILTNYNIYAPPCNNSDGSTSTRQTMNLPHRPYKMFKQLSGYDPCTEKYAEIYYNRPDVQKAMHADTTRIPYKWTACSETLNRNWNDTDDSILPIYRELIAFWIENLGFQKTLIAAQNIVKALGSNRTLTGVLEKFWLIRSSQLSSITRVSEPQDEGAGEAEEQLIELEDELNLVQSKRGDTLDDGSIVSFGDDSIEDVVQRDSMSRSSEAFINVRKDGLDDCLFILEVEKLSIEDVLKMDWDC
ncbi:hypothetical protein HAX54_039673 [Datura stramonium]|uniref:Carboxypeptidase n=1 Tax=Datura stramonium TaxID=4076 RepID=A0ABS8SKA4_DATST|nr:hypothetical protein [Datura stramonium]